MPVSKGRHLVMFDRRMIEDMLRDGESVGAIAGKIGVSWATVAREIKRHRTRDTTHYQSLDKNLCQFRDGCRMTHVELRKILPKGTCFEGITNYELSVICSHVNSYTRPVLGGAAPIDNAGKSLPADLLDGLAIERINPDEVVMRPSLLVELGLR